MVLSLPIISVRKVLAMGKKQIGEDVEYYMSLPYTVEIRRTEGGYFARVEELPGCLSQGETKEDALSMIEDAMRAWIGDALAEGDPIPEPLAAKEYSGELRVRMPKSLHRAAVRRAREDGVSLNQFISVAIARAVGE